MIEASRFLWRPAKGIRTIPAMLSIENDLEGMEWKFYSKIVMQCVELP
jgi:hypothetical protein